MLIENVATIADHEVSISNYKVSDEDLPAFLDLEFEHINEPACGSAA